MANLNNKLAIFFEIDSSTYLLIALFCGAASYFVRTRLLNTAVLVFLYPLFCLGAFALYAGFMHAELFSPKRHSDWIMYSVFAAAGGCAFGILLLSLLRRFQEHWIERAHERHMAKKEAERARERAELELQMSAAEAAMAQPGTPAKA